MPAPTNISAVTAIELGLLPNSITQNVNDGGTTYTVWYKYTAQAGDFEIGLWAFGDLTTYFPALTVYDTDGVTVILGLAGVVNVPVQFPAANGHTYFFKVVSSTGNVATASLTIAGQHAPAAAVPAGSILINDDSVGFPGILLSASASTVLKFIDAVTGEFGDALLNGMFLLNDQTVTGGVVLYNADFTVHTTLTIAGGADVVGIRSNRVDTFYVGLGDFTIHTVSSAGVIGATVWTLPIASALWTFAPTRDDHFLYYVPYDGVATDSKVYKYNLLTSTDLGVFLAAQSPYFVTQDLLVLADNTLLVGYKKSFPLDYKVEHRSAAGALILSIDFGAVFSFATLDYRLALTTDDLTTFWAKTFPTDTTVTQLQQVRVSDGGALVTYTLPTFEEGAFQPAATATPTRFGPSGSCPLLTVGAAVPTGTIIVTKTTPTILGTTVSFPFGATGGLSPSSFALTTGHSETFTDVPAGSGYGVFETAPDGWTVSYTVSNGSPIDNLTVAAHETVTVTATNVPTAVGVTDPIRRLRQMPHLSDRQLWQFFNAFQLDMENGLGLSTGQGSDPQIMLSWSDDGGHTWSPERWVSAGMQGQYTARAIWRRLGRSRDRVWRIVVSDPVPWRLNQALISVSEGTS